MTILTKIRSLFAAKLSDNDETQAQIMGMALAALKCSEVNAQLIVKQGKALEIMQRELLSGRQIVAHYTIAANDAKTKLEGFTPGTIEYEGMLMMSSKLYELAELVEGTEAKKNNTKEAATDASVKDKE